MLVRRIAVLVALAATLTSCGSEPEQVYVSEDQYDTPREVEPALEPRTAFQDAQFLTQLRASTFIFGPSSSTDATLNESVAALGYSVCEAIVNRGVTRNEIGDATLQGVSEMNPGLPEDFKLDATLALVDTAIEVYCPDQAE